MILIPKIMVKNCALLIALVLLCSCQRRVQTGPNQNSAPTNSPKVDEKMAQIRITSAAFQEGGMIPKQYTCEGANISPPLAWDSVPVGTKTLALICDDPDAPAKTWTHWVLFNLPSGAKELPEKVPPQEKLAGGGVQGMNDFRKTGYGGPCPPPGSPHRYYFKLYALDTDLALNAGATKEQLLKGMEGHVVAGGQLLGKYQR